MNNRRHHELLKANWEDIGIRLVAYACWKARNLAWRRGSDELLARGKTAEDIAGEAIMKVFAGDRGWEPRRGPLLPYLRRVVDSLISHLAASADNRLVKDNCRDWFDPSFRPPGEEDAGPGAVQVASSCAGATFDERIDQLKGSLLEEQDAELTAVLDAVLAGCEPRPQTLAGYLEVSVQDVNNRLKRLRRRAQSLTTKGHEARRVERA